MTEPADVNYIEADPEAWRGASRWWNDAEPPVFTYGGVAEQREVKESNFDIPTIESWDTGAIRDTQIGKLRYDLIDPAFIARVAEVMREGAEHYGEFNWTKGIPSQRYMASLLRHIFAYYSGDRSEDHLAKAAFNIQGLMRNEGSDLDDLFKW